MTYYLRFPSVEKGMEMLAQANYLDENGDVICASHKHAIDVIGIIKQEAAFDGDQNIPSPITELAGWHINFRGDFPNSWGEFEVSPKHPYRVFL